MLNKGADVNAQGGVFGNALRAAIEAPNHDQIVQMLLDNGAIDVDDKALKAASRKGYDHLVRILLDKRGEDYVQFSDLLNSAMAMASERGYDEVVRTLQEFQR